MDIREHYIICDTNMKAYMLYSETLDIFKEWDAVNKTFKKSHSLQIYLKSGYAFYFVSQSFADIYLTGYTFEHGITPAADWEKELKELKNRERINKYLGGV